MNNDFIDKKFHFLPETDRILLHDFFEHLPQEGMSYQLASINYVLNGKCFRELSYETIMVNHDEWFRSAYRSKAISFILFLCDNQIIPDCCFYNLLAFRRLFNSETIVREAIINYILEASKEEIADYRKSYLCSIEDLAKYPLVSMTLDKEKFSNGAYIQMLPIFNSFKYFEDGTTLKYKTSRLRKMKHTIEEFFHVQPDEIQFNDAISYIKCNPTKTNIVFTVLDALEKNNSLNDQKLSDVTITLRRLSEDFNISLSFEIVWAICQSACPERWIVSNPLNSSFRRFIYIDATDPVKFEYLRSFADTIEIRNLSEKLLFEKFDASLEKPAEELTFDTYLHQVNYFSNAEGADGFTLTVLSAFYSYLYRKYDNEIFSKSGIPNSLLNRTGLVKEILNGYGIILYNKFDKVPSSDKWILCFRKNHASDLLINRSIDFSAIANTHFRRWAKEFIWRGDGAVLSRIGSVSRAAFSLNYINELKTGTKHSFFAPCKQNEVNIYVNEIRAAKHYILESYNNNRTQHAMIYDLRLILQFVSDYKLENIDPGVFFELSHFMDTDYDNSDPLTIDELGRLASYMKSISQNNAINSIFNSLFYIAVESVAFRPSQIFNLQVDCVRETAKKNEYVLISATKGSPDQRMEQPITTYVKREIDEILRLTQPYRNNITDMGLKNHLLVVPGHKKGSYRPLSQDKFNEYLKGCCKAVGIRERTLQNLRDTGMTNAEEYVLRKNLNDYHMTLLTQHKSSDTTRRYYSRPDLQEMLEATNGVLIGDVDLKGNIMTDHSDMIEDEHNLVSDKCGYCSSPVCKVFDDLDCMMCPHFVTTVSRLPYFIERIKMIDTLILKANLNHDKEDLMNQKALMLGYVARIIEVKERQEHGGN